MDRLRLAAVALGLFAFAATPACAKSPEDQANDQAEPAKEDSAKADEVKPVVEAGATDALKEMSNFLKSADTLEIDTVGSLDVVTNNGQRIQMEGTTNYKVRKPGFVIDYRSDIKNRRFIYDGKSFTVHSPKLGFYATVPAPATNREVLEAIYKKFGIALPLEDLFRWGEGSTEDRLKSLESAYKVGIATIDGTVTDHYAFREPNIDWQLWIQQGDQPFPRKLVIIDRKDPVKPAFTSRLSWKFNPTFSDADFTFVPGADDKRIELATYKGTGE